MTDNLEASQHKPARKRLTRNPKPKRRAFDDERDDLLGITENGAEPKSDA